MLIFLKENKKFFLKAGMHDLAPEGISSMLLLCAHLSLGKCWLVLVSLSWLQGLDCHSELDVPANLLTGVFASLMPMLISSPVNILICVSSGDIKYKCKRISHDESYLPHQQLQPCRVPTSSPTYELLKMKYYYGTTLHAVFQSQIIVNLFLQNRTHYRVYEES